MKNRFSALDLRAVVVDATSAGATSLGSSQPAKDVLLPVGCRVINVYDYASPTTVASGSHAAIAFKLQHPAGRKLFVILDAPTRAYVSRDDAYHSQYVGNTPTLSPLCAKLRKELRGRRLMHLQQCGWDRVLHLQFGFFGAAEEAEEPTDTTEDVGQDADMTVHDGSDEKITRHVFVEMYAQGNVILTDELMRVMMLARTLPTMRVGDAFVVPEGPFPPEPTLEDVQACLRIAKAREQRNALRALYPLIPNALLDECARQRVSAEFLWAQCQTAHRQASALGAHMAPLMIAEETVEPVQWYELFGLAVPPNAQSYGSFNDAVDAFFRRCDAESATSQTSRLEQAAAAKLATIGKEQMDRMRGLEEARSLHILQAQALAANESTAMAACQVVRIALTEQGSTWREVEDLVSEEQRLGRPLAKAMLRFDWPQQVVVLSLPLDDKIEYQGKQDQQEKKEHHQDKEQLSVEVPVKFREGVHANVNRLYELAKRCQDKAERTRQAHQEAMKSAKRKVYQDLRRQLHGQAKAAVGPRQALWFQKFAWFVTSDGLLVLAGRDAHQNEVLVKRHLAPSDVYVHADVVGAASVVLKLASQTSISSTSSTTPDGEPPLRSIHEASQFACILSRAWDAKVVVASWWVWGRQVSKSAPSGEYLPTGSFMVRGRKHLMPPLPLQAGFGLLFLSATTPSPMVMEDKGNEGKEDGGEDEELRKLQAKYDLLKVETEDDGETVELVESGNVPLPKVVQSKGKPSSSASSSSSVTLSTASSSNTSSTASVSASTSKRGQRSKQRKIKERYGDQDDEERAMRMQLLGHRKSTKEVPLSKDDNNHSKKLSDPKPPKRTSESNPSSSKTPSGVVLEEEAIAAPSDDVLKRLLADPRTIHDDNAIQQCVPMFGPWLRMRHLPFVVRLHPAVGGTAGKGRVCKDLQQRLAVLDKESRWTPMVRAVPDTELQHTLLPSKVTIIGPGDERIPSTGSKGGRRRGPKK